LTLQAANYWPDGEAGCL